MRRHTEGKRSRFSLLLTDSRGEGYPLVIAVTLALLLLFCVIGEYFRLSIIVQGVRDAASQAVISVMNDNYDDVYPAAREGYAAGWQPGADIVHDEFGPGWVWGSGHGVITVRFETAETGPGPVRNFPLDDPALSSG